MNFNNYTIKSQEAIQQALQVALLNGQQAIEPAHLLKAIIETDENVTPYLFKKFNINLVTFTKTIESIVASFPKVSGGQPYLSTASNQVLAKATSYLKELNDEFVAIEHILLGVLSTSDTVANLMKDQGITEKGLKSAIQELRKGDRVTSQTQEETYNALSKYAVNLNKQAQSGKLDPVIGRDEEIRRVLQILSRRTKNNPILVGEPGVGKTAIAEGLAHRIIKNKTIVCLRYGRINCWS
jgi:ATP-dependent Clp protease ATP-binding subunit ClpB